MELPSAGSENQLATSCLWMSGAVTCNICWFNHHNYNIFHFGICDMSAVTVLCRTSARHVSDQPFHTCPELRFPPLAPNNMYNYKFDVYVCANFVLHELQLCIEMWELWKILPGLLRARHSQEIGIPVIQHCECLVASVQHSFIYFYWHGNQHWRVTCNESIQE